MVTTLSLQFLREQTKKTKEEKKQTNNIDNNPGEGVKSDIELAYTRPRRPPERFASLKVITRAYFLSLNKINATRSIPIVRPFLDWRSLPRRFVFAFVRGDKK